MSNQNAVQIILVLYKTRLTDSLTYQTLCENIQYLGASYELIVYNNSPEIKNEKSKDYLLVNSDGNSMLVGPYNFALQRAIDNHKDWLLLLDQDTKLTKKYFEEIGFFLQHSPQEDVAAAVPICKKGNRFVSPRTYSPFIGLSWFCIPIKHSGITHKCISAINSASLLNVSTLNQIGGFSSKYPLDALDHWYYFQFYKLKKSILIMNSEIEQNLSLFDFKKNISCSRYQSILASELRFNKEISTIAVLAWKLRLIPRTLKLALRGIKQQYLKTTLVFLFK